ncbi:MAG: hypothetical protein H6Q06_2107, partial [Acidobacteria bacterium]|nr:hypothetical protein [Acidobacteriota bacterium]
MTTARSLDATIVGGGMITYDLL